MADIVIRQVPKDVYAVLKLRAKAHRRSVNQEALACIKSATGRPLDVKAFLKDLEAIHERIHVTPLSEEEIEAVIAEGRP